MKVSIFLPIWPFADARVLQSLRALRLVRLWPWLRADVVTRQQPSDLDELLRTVRTSAFELQSDENIFEPTLSPPRTLRPLNPHSYLSTAALTFCCAQLCGEAAAAAAHHLRTPRPLRGVRVLGDGHVAGCMR